MLKREPSVAKELSHPQGRPQPMHAPVVSTGRDLRLDLFRGIALWLIFLDHIPSNLVAWATIRNYGFSDATKSSCLYRDIPLHSSTARRCATADS